MDRPVLELVRRRFSCRAYLRKPIAAGDQARLTGHLEGLAPGPFGGRPRFLLMAAAPDDEGALRGLGTYGTIRNPQGFIVGIKRPGPGDLEDFGYLMERVILEATDLGLGTCWLGGFFRKSRFVRKAGLAADETVAAVAAVGYCADAAKTGGLFGLVSRRSVRLPAEKLFFSETFDRPLTPGEAGRLAAAPEAVRWGPSASNKQPWRIVRRGRSWHFFLRRTRHYGRSGLLGKVLDEADLQRIDMGIAMCHFELAAREAGAAGTWERADPGIVLPDDLTSYTATWRETEPR